MPPVLQAVAWDNPPERTNYERHSIPVTDEAAAQYGLSFNKIEDFDFWWGMGAFTHPKVINLTIDIADQWQMWNYAEFKPFKDLGITLKSLGLLSLASQWLDPDPNGNLTSEVNKVTYRTPDAQLASAQDFRKGEKGYQQHIWQATLSPMATVFTTHPPCAAEDGSHRPNFWHGNTILPRVAQWKDTLIAIHKLPEDDWMGFTHAYFPVHAFDAYVMRESHAGTMWAFARKGEGYLALTASGGLDFITQGLTAYRELRSYQQHAVWLCCMGRAALDGDFDAFQARVLAMPLAFGDLSLAVVISLLASLVVAIYFIPMLLAKLRESADASAINWTGVEALLPYGGIRIEDDVHVTAGAPENLSRDAFRAVAA